MCGKHKDDEEYWGVGNKQSFPEETLYYEYSDCEDKSILFAFLMKEVLGMKTVAIDYKNHVNIGLALDEVKEDWFTINAEGQKYIVCEPSTTGGTSTVGRPNNTNHIFKSITPLY